MSSNKSKEVIHIAYIPEGSLSLVSMYSVLRNTPEAKINFIILYSDLTNQELKDIEKLKKIRPFTVRYFKIDENDFKGFPLATWVGIQTWFRFQIPELCPDLNKIIYLDSDTLVRKSLLSLWQMDIRNKVIAGVEDSRNVKNHISRLKMKDKSYFNAGVLLLNLKKLRKIAPFQKIKEYVLKHKDILKYNDQDMLNLLGDGRKMNLPIKYNYMEPWWIDASIEYTGNNKIKYEKARLDASIVHFVGPKPNGLGCKNTYAKEWWQYAKKLPIYKRELKKIKALDKPRILQVKSIKFLFFLPLVKIAITQNKKIYNLLGVFPLLERKSTSHSLKFNLFKFVPLLKLSKKGK